MITGNPYHNGDPSRLNLAPFAGRQSALARVGALVADGGRSTGLLFTAWRSMGKTALLHAIIGSLPETFIGGIVSLRSDVPRNEKAWFLQLAETITGALVERNFTLSRLSDIEPPGDDPRLWFEDVFLPPIFGAMRTNHQIILMLDDVERLITVVRGGQLPSDTFAYLSSLMARTGGLHLILTMDDEYESETASLYPLIGLKDIVRLTPLDPDDVRWLLTAPVNGDYVIGDEAINTAISLSGGFPAAAQRLGYHLYERWRTAPEVEMITSRDIRAVQPTLNLRGEDEYRALRERMSVNEKIILTALSNLHYNDPLRKATAESIQRWLVETETPLDVTTIQAALRALEYRHAVAFSPEGVSIRAGLFVNWLLENAQVRGKARITAPTTPVKREPTVAGSVIAAAAAAERPAPRGGVSPRVLRLLAVMLFVVIVANVIVFLLTNTAPPTTTIVPTFAPTATFIDPAITPLFSG